MNDSPRNTTVAIVGVVVGSRCQECHLNGVQEKPCIQCRVVNACSVAKSNVRSLTLSPPSDEECTNMSACLVDKLHLSVSITVAAEQAESAIVLGRNKQSPVGSVCLNKVNKDRVDDA